MLRLLELVSFDGCSLELLVLFVLLFSMSVVHFKSCLFCFFRTAGVGPLP